MLDLKDTFIKIIESNSANDAINIISKIKNPINNEKLGISKAKNIYKLCITSDIVKYDMVKHSNNINNYSKELKKYRNK